MDYLIRKELFNLFGAAFHIYGTAGELLGYSKQKAFKLKEDIRIYRDESMVQERFLIQARNIIDFSAAYDVSDSSTGECICTWKRKGFSSILCDSWIFMRNEREEGTLEEDSLGLALVRRLLCNLIPQTFELRSNDNRLLVTYTQRFNPFIQKVEVTIHDRSMKNIEGIALSGGVLLVAIEGRQQ